LEKDVKIPVTIRIRGGHLTDGEDTDLEEVHEGIFSKRAGVVYLVYEYPENVNNMIKLRSESADIIKTFRLTEMVKSGIKEGESLPKSSRKSSGKRMAELYYSTKENKAGFYETPYGRLETEAEVGFFSFMEDESSVACVIKGKLKINNSPCSVFELNIRADAK